MHKTLACFLKNERVKKFQVILTPTHLAIVMEYASGGELFERICNAGRFNEDEVLPDFLVFSFGSNFLHARTAVKPLFCTAGSLLFPATYFWS